MKAVSSIDIIENDAPLRGLLKEWLTAAGYFVRERRLRELPAGERADVVIVDLYMPRHAGIEIVRAVKRAYAGAAVIAMSAQVSPGLADSKRAAEALGAHWLMAKPFTREDLLGAVRTVLERRGAGEGNGLGLALVHGVVADYDGAIDAATQAGVGTTFTIWLPAAGDAVRPAPETARELPRGNGETLMIVDDERPLVALAEETLAELGYEPAGFDSSVAALRAFRAEPQRFDLVLTDEMMPELSGTELAREIRHLRRDLPIVMMSGHADAQLVDRAHAAGVGDVLRKPLVKRDIAEALARALRPDYNRNGAAGS